MIPIEHLRHFVAHVAHAALPPRTSVDECDVWIDVGAAATASGDNLVGDDLDGCISFLERTVRSEDQPEGKLRLAQ